MLQFNPENFHTICDDLATREPVFGAVLKAYGYPPMWTRPNTYETLVLTILEQQVSLASAFAAYKKLKEKLSAITPQGILQLRDEELRSCYLSRQKIVYVRVLAEAILSKQVNLKRFEKSADSTVRTELKMLKGIGDWTVDIYLLHALQRTDIFPLGDLALVNAVRMLFGESISKETMLQMGEAWRPFRSVVTMILWHYYIQKKNIKVLH